MLIKNKKTYLFILFLVSGCTFVNPGINSSPSSNSLFSSLKDTDVSMKDVTINYIDLSLLKPSEIKALNLVDVKNEKDFLIKKNDEIYNYSYEYFLGAGDKILITFNNNTDSNGSYIIGSEGTIDLPFVGNIVLDGLSEKMLNRKLEKRLQNFIKIPSYNLRLKNTTVAKFLL